MTAKFRRTGGDGLALSILGFLRAFLSFAGRKGAIAAGLVVLGALFEGIGLALIVPLLALLFRAEAGDGIHRWMDKFFSALGATSPVARIALVLASFAAAMIVRSLVLLARDVALARLRIGFIEFERTKIAELLAKAAWSHVSALRHARILHVMSGDIQQIGVAAYMATQCASAGAMLLGSCALTLLLSPPMALLSFLILAAGGVALLPIMRHARSLGVSVIGSSQNLLHGTAQFLGGLKLAVSQNLQHHFLREFRQIQSDQSAQQIVFLRQQTEARLFVALLSALIGAVLVLVGLAVFQVPPPILVALLLVMVRMSGPASQIQQGAQTIANAIPAFEAVQSLAADLQAAPAEISTAAPAIKLSGDIVFSHVRFIHPSEGERRGVSDLSLAISAGTMVGVRGPSGAGKTTFADLLAGLYPPQAGTITVGGAALAGAGLAYWRDHLGYVTQDPFLLHDTIRRNLVWANPQAEEGALWAALETAAAADFIRALPDGLDTLVGERGTLISGGERQRLALARALLRWPQVLILDEATNALDPATEAAILQRLAGLSPRPTMIVIAHRPESLRPCDAILDFCDGRATASKAM